MDTYISFLSYRIPRTQLAFCKVYPEFPRSTQFRNLQLQHNAMIQSHSQVTGGAEGCLLLSGPSKQIRKV